MAKIKSIKAIEVLDSRGFPTLKVKLKTGFGLFEASVPSGTSKGKKESKEIRDGETRFFGQGVKRAIEITERIIAPRLKGVNSLNQKKIDKILISLDGTKDKSRLGVNSILATSMAIARAGAFQKKMPLFKYIASIFGKKLSKRNPPLPSPFFLMIEGGKHANSLLDVQEFIVIPEGKNFEEKLQGGAELYHHLGEILKNKYGVLSSNVGLEGGFVPPINRTGKALELILRAAKERNCLSKIKIGLDVAASHFYKNHTYSFEDSIFTGIGLTEFYLRLIFKYPLISLEDPLFEEDLEGWGNLMSKVKNPAFAAPSPKLRSVGDKAMAGEQKSKVLIVGDDLTVSNPKMMERAKKYNACNALILKPNQIGTITETLEAAKLARDYGWNIIVSHRSGETCDDFISDLAVGIGADYIKTGAPCRGERVSKYNRLLEIERNF